MQVLFDLDGTLTDPREGFVRSVAHALKRLGEPVPEEDVLATWIGPPIESSFRQQLGSNAAPARVAEAVAYYRERYSAEGFLENYVYPGIEAALRQLHAIGATLFIATSKPRPIALQILDHFGLAPFFSGIYGSELDGTRSDKSELLRYLISSEHLNTHETVMVGDRLYDIRAAHANDVHGIGVLWGYGSRDELQEAGADSLCASPEQLASVVRARFL